MATARREESDVEEDFNPFLSPPPPALNPAISAPALPPRTNTGGGTSSTNNNSSGGGSAGNTGTHASASSSSSSSSWRRGPSRRNGDGANPFAGETGQQVGPRVQFFFLQQRLPCSSSYTLHPQPPTVSLSLSLHRSSAALDIGKKRRERLGKAPLRSLEVCPSPPSRKVGFNGKKRGKRRAIAFLSRGVIGTWTHRRKDMD